MLSEFLLGSDREGGKKEREGGKKHRNETNSAVIMTSIGDVLGTLEMERDGSIRKTEGDLGMDVGRIAHVVMLMLRDAHTLESQMTLSPFRSLSVSTSASENLVVTMHGQDTIVVTRRLVRR